MAHDITTFSTCEKIDNVLTVIESFARGFLKKRLSKTAKDRIKKILFKEEITV
jgi:hypothetical protein